MKYDKASGLLLILPKHHAFPLVSYFSSDLLILFFFRSMFSIHRSHHFPFFSSFIFSFLLFIYFLLGGMAVCGHYSYNFILFLFGGGDFRFSSHLKNTTESVKNKIFQWNPYRIILDWKKGLIGYHFSQEWLLLMPKVPPLNSFMNSMAWIWGLADANTF